MKNVISKATLQRYPIYLKALRNLKEKGYQRVMSSELSQLVAIKPTTIRKDFSLIGNLGKQGYGYSIDSLIDIFSDKLGINFAEKIVLIGAGNIGKALLNYNHWENVVGEIVCAFDLNPESIINLPVPCYNIKDFKEKVPKNARIAILTASQDIQKLVDLLVSCGIKGIIDFTNEHYVVPNDVKVKNIDIVSKIQELVFETNNLKEN